MHPKWPTGKANLLSIHRPWKQKCQIFKLMIPLDTFKFNMKACFRIYHPDQAKKSFWPKSFRSFAKLNMKVYISTVGSATPSIRRGCPPKIECTIPQNAVDARVCTAVKVPSVKHSNPNQINMPQKKRLCLL